MLRIIKWNNSSFNELWNQNSRSWMIMDSLSLILMNMSEVYVNSNNKHI